jgi:hypothetical protein
MEDHIVIDSGEISSLIHFLNACKTISSRQGTDLVLGPRGMTVRCGESDWGFTGNLDKSHMVEFEISKFSEFTHLNFDDITKLKTKDLHRMSMYPINGCLRVKFLNNNHDEIFTEELCPRRSG